MKRLQRVGLILGVLLAVAAAAAFLLADSESVEAQIVQVDGNHYKCYPIVELETPFDPVAVTLRDQFAETHAWVLRPVELCNPVFKNDEPVPDPDVHLVCYEISEPLQPRHRVRTSNQFGDLRFVVKDAETLCVPSKKEEIPFDTGTGETDP